MRGMNVLLHLPTDVIHVIYLEWLMLTEFTALDTALCSQCLRPMFLDSIRPVYPSLVFNVYSPEHNFILSGSVLRYLMCRNVAIEKMNLSNLAFLQLDNVQFQYEALKKLQILTFSSCNSISCSLMVQCAKICRKLTKLALTNSADISNSMVTSFIEFNHKTLKSISLCSCLMLKDTILLEVARNCNGLEEFLVSNCPKITDEGILDVIRSKDCIGLATSLKTLHLADNRQLDKETIVKFINWLTQLTDIDISGCYKITDDVISSLCKQHNRHLLSLNIGDTDCTDISMTSMATYCPNITALNISDCCDISDQGISILVSVCHQIKSFQCRSCMEISSVGIIALVTQCDGITLLDVSKCIDIRADAVQAIAAHCSALESLSISLNDEVGDTAMLVIASQCHSLTSVDVSYCIDISDDSMVDLINRNPKLASINCAECDLITGKTFMSLASCNFLKEINMTMSGELNDSHLIALIGCCPLLEVFAMSGNKLTDSSFAPFFESCKRLTHVDISGNSLVTDATIFALSRCKQLLKCNFSGCFQLTNTTIRSLVASAKGLIELDISNCPLIDDVGIKLLTDGGCSLLEILYCFCHSKFKTARTQKSIEDLALERSDLVIIETSEDVHNDDQDLDNDDEMDYDFDGEDESIDDQMEDTDDENDDDAMDDENIVILLQPDGEEGDEDN